MEQFLSRLEKFISIQKRGKNENGRVVFTEKQRITSFENEA